MSIRHWAVMGSEPYLYAWKDEHGNEKTSSQRKNIECHVIAETAQRALEATRERHPNMEIFTITSRGHVDIIYDVSDQERP